MFIEIQVKGKWHEIEYWEDEERMYFKPKFDKEAKNTLKESMDLTWHGGSPPNWDRANMHYSAVKTERNLFTVDFLRKDRPNPYAPYKEPAPIIDLPPRYNKQKKEYLKPFQHQVEMVSFVWHRKRAICAAQMRTGKTLCMITLMEFQKEEGAKDQDLWLVGPRSGLAGVQLDFDIWGSKVTPRFMTYDRMKKLVLEGCDTPVGVYFDEASKLKNPKAQRTQAAMYLAEEVRKIGGLVSLWTGTPSPKSPVDWWSQVETVRPGYIAERNTYLFTERLAIVSLEENQTGGHYPKIKTWLDNPDKCALCGGLLHKDHEFIPNKKGRCDTCGEDDHSLKDHAFLKSKNEVEALYKRLKGITKVVLKDDVLDLPDKVFERVYLKPSSYTMQMYNTINSIGQTAATILTLQRELSDGFLYRESEGELTKCKRCKGHGKVITYGPEIHLDIKNTTEELFNEYQEPEVQEENETEKQWDLCPKCQGTGLHPGIKREPEKIECPKYDYVRNLLDEHEECGRLVIYAGFQGSVDRITETCLEKDWPVIRVDGRGWHYFGCSFSNDRNALAAFAKYGDYPDKLVWVGHPASGGMGVSLSASPTILFFSNSFAAEDRLQAVERIHDLGMSKSLGARIIDLINLPTDELVLENLDRKEKLQKVTMGDIKNAEFSDWSTIQKS